MFGVILVILTSSKSSAEYDYVVCLCSGGGNIEILRLKVLKNKCMLRESKWRRAVQNGWFQKCKLFVNT